MSCPSAHAPQHLVHGFLQWNIPGNNSGDTGSKSQSQR
jgi:hypothetical protein